MAYGIDGHMAVNYSKAEVEAMQNYSHIRLFHMGTQASRSPLIEAPTTTKGWSETCPLNNATGTRVCRGAFSAVCWFYGRNIYAALAAQGKARPIGLIETNVGGTPIEHWSSPDALAQCYSTSNTWDATRGPKGESGLWNGMVTPLLNSTIYGVVWYQGEQNAGRPGGHSGYNCSFPAMISDWRSKWHAATGGLSDAVFPFGFVQLNGNGNGPSFTGDATDDPVPERPCRSCNDAGGDYSNRWGFAGLRWAQTAGYGYVPNPKMPRTFMAVILDTPNPSGGVHSPFKQPVGSRLARAGLEVAYGVKQESLGPRVQGVRRLGPNLTITFIDVGSGSGIEVHNTTGFELLVPAEGPNASTTPGTWVNAKIVAHNANTVTIGAAPPTATRLRYEWYGNACGLSCFECAVYTAVTPLGNLSGEAPSAVHHGSAWGQACTFATTTQPHTTKASSSSSSFAAAHTARPCSTTPPADTTDREVLCASIRRRPRHPLTR